MIGLWKLRRQGEKMIRRVIVIALVLVLAAGIAAADSITSMHYVFQDWSGEYTGKIDSNNIPFGFGIFISSTARDNELWHYIGEWEDGLPEGEGAIYFENGNIEKGTFSQGEMIDGMKYSVSGIAAVPVRLERSTVDEDVMYIGNKKSMRFHLPTCRSVTQMKESNKMFFHSREEAVEGNYIPCGDCNP